MLKGSNWDVRIHHPVPPHDRQRKIAVGALSETQPLAKIQRVVSNFTVVKIYVKICVGQVRHYFVRWTYRVITST